APSVSINLSELDSGSWVIFELPDSPPQRRAQHKAASMHCAAQPAPRTTKAKTHFGSRLSRPAAPQVVAVVAVAAGGLSKSASKLKLTVKAKTLGASRGLSCYHDRFRETGTSIGDKPRVLVATELSYTSP